ncbi:hypothetical protein BCR32DRAFT_302855 [Anaeromyces robustus]|uniref:Uncharacterized protein n=1 Tax=Anaeromyces robustus TaxID=1754192 RepID=A0A1Y1WUC6_9FUNG|nr:hypothetical protein BCR32DRAFT_302855 [Anaeromyces robustus]|eukprot:ORX77150.1 hypothetical protein BCR32DRAFT_302855 [Anaeromyces robustus]
MDEFNKRLKKLNNLEKLGNDYETSENQIKILKDQLEESEKIINDLREQLEKITNEKENIYIELTNQLNKIGKEIINQNKKIQCLNEEKTQDQKEIELYKDNIQKYIEEKNNIEKELNVVLNRQKENNDIKIKNINQKNEDLISLLKAEISNLKIKVIQLKNQKNKDPIYNKNYLISIISIFFYKMKIAKKEKENLQKLLKSIIKNKERTKNSVKKWKYIKNLSPMLFNNYILNYKYISNHLSNIISYRNKIQINLNKLKESTSASSAILGSNPDISSISDFSDITSSSSSSSSSFLFKNTQLISKTKSHKNNKINSSKNNQYKNTNNNSKINNKKDNKKLNSKYNKNSKEIEINSKSKLTKFDLNSIENQNIKNDQISDIDIESELLNNYDFDFMDSNSNNTNNNIFELLSSIHHNLNKIKRNSYAEHNLIKKKVLEEDTGTSFNSSDNLSYSDNNNENNTNLSKYLSYNTDNSETTNTFSYGSDTPSIFHHTQSKTINKTKAKNKSSKSKSKSKPISKNEEQKHSYTSNKSSTTSSFL